MCLQGSQMSVIEVFQKYYSSLIQTLPMNDVIFISTLYSNSLLPGNLKPIVQSLPTAADKAAKLLDDVIEPSIKNNASNNFNKLLKVMKESSYDNVNLLAVTIRSSLVDHDQSSHCTKIG